MKTQDKFAAANSLKAKMIEFANQTGINLAESFKTVEEFNDFVISFGIKALLDNGVTMEKAIDVMLGKGTYQSIIEKI